MQAKREEAELTVCDIWRAFLFQRRTNKNLQVDLMREATDRSRELEERLERGLVIVEASYGKILLPFAPSANGAVAGNFENEDLLVYVLYVLLKRENL